MSTLENVFLNISVEDESEKNFNKIMKKKNMIIYYLIQII